MSVVNGHFRSEDLLSTFAGMSEKAVMLLRWDRAAASRNAVTKSRVFWMSVHRIQFGQCRCVKPGDLFDCIVCTRWTIHCMLVHVVAIFQWELLQFHQNNQTVTTDSMRSRNVINSETQKVCTEQLDNWISGVSFDGEICCFQGNSIEILICLQ